MASESTSSRQQRVTPRNSNAQEAIAAGSFLETPYGTLHQLANIIPKPRTPLRRASSAGPPSTHRSTRRTPAPQARTPGAAQRLGGSGKGNALTPHGRAAIREVLTRRAGLTPRNDRRRSGRQQRETPRDTLRALSRSLAATTQRIESSPQVPPDSIDIRIRTTLSGRDDLDDGQDIEIPRLSLPIGDDDEDDSLILPLPLPLSTELEDENFTVQSVEFPRRAVSEQPGELLSRGSFGSIRTSDRFADLNDMGLNAMLYDGFDSSLNIPSAFEDEDVPNMDELTALGRENTEPLRGADFQTDRVPLVSSPSSDIRPTTLPRDDNDTTFVLTVPQRNMSILEVSDVVPDSSDDDESQLDRIEIDEPGSVTVLQDVGDDLSRDDTTHQGMEHISEKLGIVRKSKVKVSKHGIRYPSLPAHVVKKLAITFARIGGNSRAKISKDTLDAIMQASDWFFEQVSDDLGAYAKHGGRKTIDESDIVTLMSRQRQTNAVTTPFSLAQRYLPRELLQEMRMAPPSRVRTGRLLASVEEREEA